LTPAARAAAAAASEAPRHLELLERLEPVNLRRRGGDAPLEPRVRRLQRRQLLVHLGVRALLLRQ
jgi:hypothetical protein